MVHNLIEKNSQLYDLKLPDYSNPLLKLATRVSERFLSDDKVFFSDLVRAEEKKSNEEAPYSKPVIREDATTGQPLMVDPTSYLLVPEA